MDYELCIDGKTLAYNDDDELEARFDPEFFDVTDEGIAFRNSLGYFRPFTPVLYSNNTAITMGASTAEGWFSRVRLRSGAQTWGTAENLDFFVCEFNIVFKFGTGFSIPAGTLNIGQTVAPYVLGADYFLNGSSSIGVSPGLWGTAKLYDDSNVATQFRVFTADFDEATSGSFTRPYMATEAGVRVTNTVPWTWAVGDSIAIQGTCFGPSRLSVDPLN